MHEILMGDPKLLSLVESRATLPADKQLLMVMKWLVDDDESRRNVATGVIASIGANGVSRLVREALAPGKHSQQRVRLLQAVEKIGQPLQLDQVFDLNAATRRSDAAVQDQIARVLAAHRRASSQPAPRTGTPTRHPTPPPPRSL